MLHTAVLIIVIIVFQDFVLPAIQTLVKKIDKMIGAEIRGNTAVIILNGAGFIVVAYWWFYQP